MGWYGTGQDMSDRPGYNKTTIRDMAEFRGHEKGQVAEQGASNKRRIMCPIAKIPIQTIVLKLFYPPPQQLSSSSAVR